MSPASNSKAKDKKSARVHVNANVGVPPNGNSPPLGTFNTFEGLPVASHSPGYASGRFNNMDDSDDHNVNILGAATEYDSVSNNGSWSGESEELKEKTSQPLPQEPVPGADNDKREKTRLKNERKHQRQKERRAQELHERCTGYLMSRKLEALAQKLVGMGFSQERAMNALILNEGKVEESVTWLCETSNDDNSVEANPESGGNLKIDISEELANITDMEIKYKVSKQDVERAIVACEGDIGKAEEMLKAPKQEHIAAHLKSEETGDPPTVSDNKLITAVVQTAVQPKIMPSASMQQRRDEKDFNYTKVVPMMGPSVDPVFKDVRRTPHKLDWPKPHPNTVFTDKGWPNMTSRPSVSNSVASSLPTTPSQSKVVDHYPAFLDNMKTLQLGSMREPVTVMQRPQSLNPKLAPSSIAGSSPPGASMGWIPSSGNMMKSNGLVSSVPLSASRGTNGVVNPHSLYNQPHFLPQQHLVSNNGSHASQETSRPNRLWSGGGASQTLSAASSLGLFSSPGTRCSSGSSPTVDWNTGGSLLQFDYNEIDWSLDTRSLPSRSSGSWSGLNYSNHVSRGTVEPFAAYGPSMKSVNGAPAPKLPEGGVISSSEQIPGGGGGGGARDQRASAAAFDERDLFSSSRQYISSPSL